VPPMQVALPLAISFFTFQQISFLRGVYSSTDYVPGFLRYATFITFFPHLIAGPILHHKEVQPQFGHLKREVPWNHIAIGITLFSLGLFKKIMLADPLGGLADPIYALAQLGQPLSMVQGWLCAFLYGFQLYFDFSGYTDMAIGLAHLFGITFPKNFDSPYKSASIAEFWRRWHITLSQFLRDFLYIPLGGNRRGVPRNLFNLLVVMGLGGLWHGASWNFVLWGLLHGLYLALHAVWRRTNIALPRFLGWVITFLAVMAAWVLFRAPDLATASHIYAAMFQPAAFDLYLPAKTGAWLLASLAIALLLPNSVAWAREHATPALWKGMGGFAPTPLWNLAIFGTFLVAFLHLSRLSTFLYFNF
jgi:alginate O-acetyltransferase complex protein AlgI